MSVKILAVYGNFNEVPCEALVTMVPAQMPESGVHYTFFDTGVYVKAGGQFHQQLSQYGLTEDLDGETFTAYEATPHSGGFKNVIFLIGFDTRPVGKAVFEALKTAEAERFNSVVIPFDLFTTGKNEQEVASLIKQGIDAFSRKHRRSIIEVKIVSGFFSGEKAMKKVIGS